jgi:hypothetical protein
VSAVGAVKVGHGIAGPGMWFTRYVHAASYLAR